MNELIKLIVSAAGAVAIPTQEWYRAIGTVTAAVNEMLQLNPETLNYKLYTWNAAKGLVQENTQTGTSTAITEDGELITHPGQVFRMFEDSIDAKSILVLEDMHLFWRDGNPMVIAGVKNAIIHARKSQKFIVFIQNQEQIPDELKDDLPAMEFPLPNLEQRKEIISNGLSAFQLQDREVEELAATAAGLTTFQLQRSCGKIVIANYQGYNHDATVAEILKEKKAIVKQTNSLEFYELANLPQFAGYHNLQNYLRKAQKLYHSDNARNRNIPTPKGILLLGFQGCGKSLAAKTVGRQFGVPVIRVDLASNFNMYVGGSESNTKNSQKILSANAKCVAWLDEIEKAMGGTGGSVDGGTSSRVHGMWLTWMQEQSGVFIVATCNNEDVLTPELLRKGRFDEIFYIGLPNYEERKEIWQAQLRFHEPEFVQDNEYIELLAQESEFFTGAEIESCVVDAKMEMFMLDERAIINTNMLMNSVRNTIPTAKSERNRKRLEIYQRKIESGEIKNAS